MQRTARYPSPAGPYQRSDPGPQVQSISPASYTSMQNGPLRPSVIQQPVVASYTNGYPTVQARVQPTVGSAARREPSMQGPPTSASVVPPPTAPPPTPNAQARVRFTNFYRPVVSEASAMRPPAASPPNRIVFSAPMRVHDQLAPTPPTQSRQRPGSAPMQMCELRSPPAETPQGAPMAMPTLPSPPRSAPARRSNNPLPTLPVDVWGTSPYQQILANLPTDPENFDGLQPLVDNPEPVPQPSSSLGLSFGRDKGKKSVRKSNDNGAESDRHGRSGSQTTRLISPIRFNHTGEYAGFVNHSLHRVMYQNKMYPTALHLLEALKFTHKPALQERIRKCKNVNDMYPLSASFQEHVRSDWGQVFLKVMEGVLYLKFKQHPSLRALLLGTGDANIIYADENSYWGEGHFGDGANELGKALVGVRERLQEDSAV